MTDRDIRLSGGAGLLATLVVGGTLLIAQALGAFTVPWPWWLAYGVYVIAFVLESEVLPVRAPWGPGVTIALLLVSGGTTWLLAPTVGWAAILFIVTAVVAAYEWDRAAVAAVVAVQMVVLAAGAAMSGMGPTNTLVTALAYGAFQVFAVLVVFALRRESRSRQELAVAHAELKASHALLASSSRAAERLRIARELHDVMGHQLTALALELEVATHGVDGPAAEHVTRARGIAKNLLTDVRSTVGELRDVPAGLEPTLAQIVADVPGVAVDLTVREDRAVDADRAIAVVRCVQEVLTNTLRHADARRLAIEVTSDDDGVRVRAEDDGRGAGDVRPGNGLLGMTERAEELGGTVSVDSRPGEGFRLQWSVPA